MQRFVGLKLILKYLSNCIWELGVFVEKKNLFSIPYVGFIEENICILLAQRGRPRVQCTNKTLTTSPFGNT
jgi:hypothetical protein